MSTRSDLTAMIIRLRTMEAEAREVWGTLPDKAHGGRTRHHELMTVTARVGGSSVNWLAWIAARGAMP